MLEGTEQRPEMAPHRTSAASWEPGRFDVVWRTSDDKLGHLWFAAETFQSEVIAPQSPVMSDPCVVSWGDQRLDVFWRSSDGRLAHKWFDRGWKGEELLQQQVPGAVAAASWAPGRLDVLWRSDAGKLGHMWLNTNSTWGAEERNIELAGDPSACCWSTGRLDVFYAMADGTLGHAWFDKNWAGPESLGGAITGGPAAVSWAPGEIDVFARNTAGPIWHTWFANGSWNGWEPEALAVTTDPSAVSWADGRIDVFATDAPGHVVHGWYGGIPLASNPNDISTLWQLVKTPDATRTHKLAQAFASGSLAGGGCSGAMISPHIFATASHCGGMPMNTVEFYRMDLAAPDAAPEVQTMSPIYAAREFPWAASGIASPRPTGLQGDTMLLWVDDGPDGIPPGIAYGHQDLTVEPIKVGMTAYSFWTQAAARLGRTLLYSDGTATNSEPAGKVGDDWLGEHTSFSIWSIPGASGSTVLSGDAPFDNRVVGVTQGGPGGGGDQRTVPHGGVVVSSHDGDKNGIIDAIDYDWFITRPKLDFVRYDFDNARSRVHWRAVPNGSGVWGEELSEMPSVGAMWSMVDVPRMNARPSFPSDGFFCQSIRYEANSVYRVSLVATAKGGASVVDVSFVSPSTGDRRSVAVSASDQFSRVTGTVALGPFADYVLLIGAPHGVDATVSSIALSRESVALGFRTGLERAAWEYFDLSHSTSWGPENATTFGAVVVGPSANGLGIRNRYLGLNAGVPYSLEFTTRHAAHTPVGGRITVSTQDLGGAIASNYQFTTERAGETRRHTALLDTGGRSDMTLVVSAEGTQSIVIGDLTIRPL